MGGESASPNNPEKVCAGKRKTKNSDLLKYASIRYHKCAKSMAPDKP